MNARCILVLAVPVVTAGIVGLAPGCGTGQSVTAINSCPQAPCDDPVDAGPGDTGPGDTGQSIDAEPGQAFCPPDQCIVNPGVEWTAWPPVLLWQGDPSLTPTCPEEVPTHDIWGTDPASPPLSCVPCTCSASTGSCRPPTKFTAYAADCQIPPAGEATSFDAPSDWDGGCTAANVIDAGALCGAGINCVQSLSYDPLFIENEGCMPSVIIPPAGTEPSWGKAALGCSKDPNAYPPCENEPSKTCAPTALPPPPGFDVCFVREGEHDCPSSEYVRYVFYKNVADTRSCTTCECGPAQGSLCTGILSIFADDLCSVPVPFILGIESIESKCTNTADGVGLGSKQITDISYHPGICPAIGGEAVGQVDPAEPRTFCCLPSSPPPP